MFELYEKKETKSKASNGNLHKAKQTKNDEFYTQLTDIEKELMHYKEHFKDKIVYCNCDDPEWSNFWKYFHLNFAHLGLKKLIATFYHIGTSVYKMEYTGGDDNNISAGVKIPLTGNGDFRSEECVETLKESDIVVSNCPFSLFREYVAQLMRYEKKFLIIGNKNAITYKEFFPLLKDNKVWIGYNSPSEFNTPDGITQKVNGLCRWFTNLDIQKRHEKLPLWKNYTPEEYPKYDNYDAINVDKVTDIPCDYDGIMGVPITFLDKYNPEQFEVVCFSQGDLFIDAGGEGASEQIVKDYYAQGNKGQISVGWKHAIYYDNNGKVVAPYQRILIRKKVGAL